MESLIPQGVNFMEMQWQMKTPQTEKSKSNQDTFRALAKYMGYKEKCFTESDESMIRNMIDSKHNPLFTGITYEKLKKKGWMKGDVNNKRRNY